MSRSLHANLIATLGNDVIKPFYALEMFFDSGTSRLWTGYGNKTINGNSFSGAQDFLSISNLSESIETVSTNLTLVLSGVNTSFTSIALTENIRNRKCILYYGDMDVAETSIAFEGLMNQLSIDEGAETASLTLTVEHELTILEKSTILRYTSASQKTRFPLDTGLDFVNSLDAVSWVVK